MRLLQVMYIIQLNHSWKYRGQSNYCRCCSFLLLFSPIRIPVLRVILNLFLVVSGIVYDRIKSNAEKLCKSLQKQYKFDSEQLEVLRSNKRQLIKAYANGAIPHLKSIETYVDKFIAVPNNVLLEEDKCQRVQYTSAEFANIKQNLEDLQQRAKRAVMLNTVLKEELQLQKQVEEHEEVIAKMCNIVDQGYACPNTSSKLSDFVLDYKKFTKELSQQNQLGQQRPSNVSDQQKMYSFSNIVQCEDIDAEIL